MAKRKLSDGEKLETVTKGFCEERHSGSSRMITVIVILLISMIGVASSCVAVGYFSHVKASGVKSDLDVSSTKTNGAFETVGVKLNTIEEDVKEVRTDIKEQRKMIEDIWRSNGNRHPPGP